MWQMRGLALSRPSPKRDASPEDLAAFERRSIKLTMGPRRGVVALNGRPGHVQVPPIGVVCMLVEGVKVFGDRGLTA